MHAGVRGVFSASRERRRASGLAAGQGGDDRHFHGHRGDEPVRPAPGNRVRINRTNYMHLRLTLIMSASASVSAPCLALPRLAFRFYVCSALPVTRDMIASLSPNAAAAAFLSSSAMQASSISSSSSILQADMARAAADSKGSTS